MVASWVEYDPDYVVDFKQELNIEQCPVVFVYDQQELLFKSYDMDEVYGFLEGLKE